MLVAIQTDMPFKVILEVCQLPASFDIQLVHDSLEHIRQQIFPSKGKCRGNGTQIVAVDDCERMLHEKPSRFGNSRRRKCCLNRNTLAKFAEK